MLLEVNQSGLLGLAQGSAIRARHEARQAKASLADANARISEHDGAMAASAREISVLRTKVRDLEIMLELRSTRASGLASHSSQAAIAASTRISELEAMATDLGQRLAVAAADVKGMTQRLAVGEALYSGVVAQLEALAAAHPDSPMLAPGAQPYTDGRPKSLIIQVWERAFDAHCLKAGMDPLDFRNG